MFFRTVRTYVMLVIEVLAKYRKMIISDEIREKDGEAAWRRIRLRKSG